MFFFHNRSICLIVFVLNTLFSISYIHVLLEVQGHNGGLQGQVVALSSP